MEVHAEERVLRKRPGIATKSQDFKAGKRIPKQVPAENSVVGTVCVGSGTYWLTRIVLLRSLGFIYAIAFLIALNQNNALLGTSGLLPANQHMEQIRSESQFPLQWFVQAPTLLWFVEGSKYFDFFLDLLAYCGLLVAIVVTVTGAANVLTMLLLWILYHSIVNVGQRWYSFGWESQLLETGFLAIFFCPLLAWQQLPRMTPPSWVVLWGYRWLLFRIMIGAGLIKLRGDRCWWDLTCMNYHYETQPLPNPLSYYLHQSPEFIHKIETFGNHIIELVVPWFTFMSCKFRTSCGILQILFQVILILSGNLSFLNWLTILPSISYFDDKTLAFLFSVKTTNRVVQLQTEEDSGNLVPAKSRRITDLSLFLVLTYLSIPVIINLFSRHQVMNTSFEPLRIVNTYGAFGSITKERTEIIYQGTMDPDPNNPKAEWLEYEFKCKPGNISRRPCIISPYHYRLDWLLWFAAFQDYQRNPWNVHLAAKLLQNDPSTMTLIAHNPFENTEPPRFIRIQHYSYEFTKIGSEAAQRGEWWSRHYRKSYLPAISLSSLKTLMKKFGWKLNKF